MASTSGGPSSSKLPPSSPPAAPPRKPSVSAKASADDPILRNALRYTISAREYATLHKYVLSRSRLLKKRAPSVEAVQRMMHGDPSAPGSGPSAGRNDKPSGKGKEPETDRGAGAMVGADDYNARAMRHALRVFLTTATAMKIGGLVSARFMGQKDTSASSQKKQPLYKSPTFRLSLSLSTILLLYRLLFRFFTRLRLHLLDPSATPFRLRNPRTANTLTSPYAPAVGASLAGLALGIVPAQQLRVSVAIAIMFRALEFGWNMAEDGGMIWGWEKNGKVKKDRPWWFGSWMLQPFAFGQLLHGVVFDRDCFPKGFGELIFNRSSTYLHPKPKDYPTNVAWPGTYQVVDGLAQMARLNWPPFISPTLFPSKEDTLPPSLSALAPLTAPAHPLITSLSCATLHPSDPSCSRTYLTFWLRSFPPLARFFLILYSALVLPKFRSLYDFPVSTLHKVAARALRTSVFVTGSISTAWASICLFQRWLPRGLLATQRFFLGGFLAGLWAWVERRQGRGVFLYSARASVDSLWKVGVKRRWWRAMRGGDLWVFVAAVMLTGAVYERDARAVREGGWRKGISWVRGEGWRDWALEEEELEAGDGDEEEREGEEFEAEE